MTHVIIADDNKDFRKGLKAVLNNIDQSVCITEVTNGKEFLEAMKSCKAEIVFMDVKMPLVNGVIATKEAKKLYPEVMIYAFSSYENDDYKAKMMEAGANGYLCKSKDNYELIYNIVKNNKTCDTAGIPNKNK